MDVCSGDAIIHEHFPEGTVHEVQQDILPTPESLMELIRSRRSNRTITDREIPVAALSDIIEAARYAPTAENSRCIVVTLIENEKDIQAVEDATMIFFLRIAKVLMFPLLLPITKLCIRDLYNEVPELYRFEKLWSKGRRPCTCNGKALLVFSAPKDYGFGWQDCNLAYQNASLMAESHGVSQIYMGLVQGAFKFFRCSKVSKLLHLPTGHQMYALMSLGMPAFRYTRYTER